MSSSVDVGGYSLEAGGPGGTIVQRRAEVAAEGAESLERALATGEPRRAEGVAATAGGVVDDASAVTAKIERAVALGKGMAEGKALSPDLLGLEVGTMLDLLERLGRGKRHKEELQLARALVNLLMLVRRWAELLRALRAALRAATILGDMEAIAWAKHELGSLRILAGDVEGAERALREAREIRERIGDRRGLAATNRNMQVLCERLREMLRAEELVKARRGRRSGLRVASLATLFTLLFGVGVAVGVVTSDSDNPGEATVKRGGGSGVTGDGGSGAANDTGGVDVPVTEPNPTDAPVTEPDPVDAPVTEPAGVLEERGLADQDGAEVPSAPAEKLVK